MLVLGAFSWVGRTFAARTEAGREESTDFNCAIKGPGDARGLAEAGLAQDSISVVRHGCACDVGLQ